MGPVAPRIVLKLQHGFLHLAHRLVVRFSRVAIVEGELPVICFPPVSKFLPFYLLSVGTALT
jgi:hypothetical protein